MKLHHVPGARSCRVRWLLEELGVPYELASHRLGDPTLRTPEYRALNPLGRVPTLEDEGVAFYESVAIVQYLLERHGGGRLEPEIGSPERGPYLQWLHYGEASVMPPMSTIMAHRFMLPEKDRSEKALEIARRQVVRALGPIEAVLAGREYLLGPTFTAADITTGYSAHLLRSVGELPDDLPDIHAWLARLGERPAYQTAFEGGLGV
ncbi:MAG: glutathione S-transferase family protein [Spirochaetaceae bacterium]|nr:glutathione S-transferase family protein [Spirochaetaceae bacterium]